MELSSCRMIIKLIFCSVLLSAVGCLKKPVDAPVTNDQEARKNKAHEQIIAPFAKIQPVSGSQLKTSSFSLNSAITGNHRSLEISAIADPNADFLQYTICKVEAGTCNPSPDAPGEITSPTHRIPTPPEGLIEVSLRSCARAYKSIEGKDSCGPWVRKKFVQLPNQDPEVASLLIALYEQDNIIRQECKKIRNEIISYFNENEDLLNHSQSPQSQQFLDLLHNNLVVGEDRCAELHLNNMLALVQTDFEYSSALEAQSTSLSLTEEKDRNVGAALVLTVGALAFLGGSYQVGNNLLSLNKLNQEISKISKNYESTLVSIRQGVSFSTLRRENFQSVVNRYESLNLEYKQLIETLRATDEANALNRKLGSTYPSWDTAQFDKFIDKILLDPKPFTLNQLGLEEDSLTKRFAQELEEFRLLYLEKINLARAKLQEIDTLKGEYKVKSEQFFVGTDVRKSITDKVKLSSDIATHSDNLKRIDNAFYEEIVERSNGQKNIEQVRQQFKEADEVDQLLKSKRSKQQQLNETGFRSGITTAVFGALIAGIAYSGLDLTRDKPPGALLLEKLNLSYEVISNSTKLRHQISNSIEKE